jgi:hypothetical protein
LFERTRTFWAEKKGVWCAFDFEAWELDHTVLTEFGWRLFGWKDGKDVEEAGHLIVDEHQKYRNSKYVPEYRYVINGMLPDFPFDLISHFIELFLRTD